MANMDFDRDLSLSEQESDLCYLGNKDAHVPDSGIVASLSSELNNNDAIKKVVGGVVLPPKRVPKRFCTVVSGLSLRRKVVDCHFQESDTVVWIKGDAQLESERNLAREKMKILTEFSLGEPSEQRKGRKAKAVTKGNSKDDGSPLDLSEHVFNGGKSLITSWFPPAYAEALEKDMYFIDGTENLSVAHLFVKLTASSETIVDVAVNFLHKYHPDWTVTNTDEWTFLMKYNRKSLSVIHHLYNLKNGSFADPWHQCEKCEIVGSHVSEDCIYNNIYIAVIITATRGWTFGDWISLYHLLVETGQPKCHGKRLLSLQRLFFFDKSLREKLPLHKYIVRFCLF